MKRIKITLCTGKHCRKALPGKDLKAIEALAAGHADELKLRTCGCIGDCGKRKRGDPPFAEVGGERLDAVSSERLRAAVGEALARRGMSSPDA